jgi:hypothetical protein
MQALICAAVLRGIFAIDSYRAKSKLKTRKTMVVLGSGGHTTEMFQFLRTLTGKYFSTSISASSSSHCRIRKKEPDSSSVRDSFERH